jgi:hypothetical protein
MADSEDNFTLPVGMAPSVSGIPVTTPIPNSASQPIFTNALANATADSAPIIKTAQTIQENQDAQDKADADAQAKAAQQKVYSNYITLLQSGLGGMSDYIDAVGQKYPDLADRFRARLPQIQTAMQDPTMTPESTRDFLNSNFDSMSKETEAADKEAATQSLAASKQKEDVLGPKFSDWLAQIKNNPSYDADKLGRPFTSNEQAVLRQSAGELNGYPKFEAYLKGSTAPPVKTPASAPNTAAPTESELLAEKDLIVNNGDTVQNYIQSLPKRGMSSQEMTRIRTTLTQMTAGTYVKGSYRPSTTSNQPPAIAKAPPMNPDTNTPTSTAPSVKTGKTATPNPSPSVASTASTGSNNTIPNYNLTGDEGDAKYWNNKNTKTAIANIQNARSTIAYLMNVYKGLDNSQFPTWNTFINSTSPLVGGVKAKMAQLNTALAREEVQKAMARGGTGNIEQLKLTNSMFDPNASIPQQMAGGKAMLDAMDRWESSVGSGGGRFAGKGNNGNTTPPSIPVDFKSYTAQNPSPKSNSTADISVWLKGAGQAVTPQSIAATQKWMASQTGQ